MIASSLFLMALAATGALAAPSPRSRRCEMAAVARDTFTKAPEHFYSCRDTSTGEESEVVFGDGEHKGRMDIYTGDILDIDGSEDEGKTKFRASSFRVVRRNPDHDPNNPDRHRRALTTRTAMALIIRFVNSDGTFVGANMDTIAERTAVASAVNSTLFGVYNSQVKKTQAGMWSECSYGKLTLGYDTDGRPNDLAGDFPGSNADIFYVDVPMVCTQGVGFCSSTYNTATSCRTNEYYGWATYALNYLTANRAGFDRNAWQHKLLITPQGAGISCSFTGQGNVGCSSSACYSWYPTERAGDVQDYSHELGHNLGLGHAGDANAAASSSSAEYGDSSCAMGFCCIPRCYNAPHAVELGWLTPILALDGTKIADQQSITQVLPSMSASSQGAISIRMDWNTATPTTYWIQLKTADSYDRFASSTWLNNVQIKKWNRVASGLTSHLWKGAAGSTWSEASGQLHVTVNAIDLVGKTATVTIKRGTLAGGSSTTTTTTTAAPVTTTTTTTTTTTRTTTTTTPTTTTTTTRTTTTTTTPTTTTTTRTTTTTTAPTTTTTTRTTTTTTPATTTTTTRTTTTTTRTTTTTTTTATCRLPGFGCTSNSQCCSRSCSARRRRCN